MNTQAVKMALRNRALSALPTKRIWENDQKPDASKPAPNEEFVTEALSPNGGTLRGLIAGNVVERDYLYILTYFGIAGNGSVAINAWIDAVLALFTPGSYVTATDGSVVRVRGEVIPQGSQITNPQNMPGRAVASVTIPVRILT